MAASLVRALLIPGPMRLGLAVALLTLSSCSLYFDDDDDPCDFGGTGSDGAAEPAVGQRNPETGTCEYFGGGGGGPLPCDPECGPCPAALEESDRAPLPSWGLCESACTGLDEATCQDTTGCRAVYVDPCPDGSCGTEATFSECWAVDMTGPIQGGSCEGLDAYTCSLHDDCVAVHASSCEDGLADPGCVPAGFVRCGAEIGGAGSCYDPVVCDEAPPDCPPDTLPGVAAGCYTGFCIPVDQCEAQPACDTLDEMTCVGRADCAPSYRGSDCTCDATGCTCATFEFTGCGAL